MTPGSMPQRCGALGARSFLLILSVRAWGYHRAIELQKWRHFATLADCHLWCDWNACALWLAGPGAGSRWKRIPLRHAAHQLDGLLLSRLNRPIHDESHCLFG